MFDERVHETESRLERWEAVGRLFRDVEEYLHAIHDSLSFR